MSEYKVKMRAKVTGLFGPTFEGLEIYEAENAKDAVEQAEKEFKEGLRNHLISSDEVKFEILDVEKL